MQYNTNQPLQYKLGSSGSYAIGATSSDQMKLAETEHLMKVLSISGYWASSPRRNSDHGLPCLNGISWSTMVDHGSRSSDYQGV